jgi:hypothetical protein
MCNDYRNRKSARRLVDQFNEIKFPLRFQTAFRTLNHAMTSNHRPRADHSPDGRAAHGLK